MDGARALLVGRQLERRAVGPGTDVAGDIDRPNGGAIRVARCESPVEGRARQRRADGRVGAAVGAQGELVMVNAGPYVGTGPCKTDRRPAGGQGRPEDERLGRGGGRRGERVEDDRIASYRADITVGVGPLDVHRSRAIRDRTTGCRIGQ